MSPMVLAFFLGAIATWVRSDLKMPQHLHQALSIYLLLAIGLKGGVALSKETASIVALPLLGALGLGLVIPCGVYGLCRLIGRLSVEDAAALSAHYGSVSVVTFLASVGFIQALDLPHESFFPALVPVMEVPAIVLGIFLARFFQPSSMPLAHILREVCLGHSVLLLVGGVVMGYVTGTQGYAKVAPFFEQPFQGILVLYMLDMGMLAAERMDRFKEVGVFLVGFALLVPLSMGCLGVWVGSQMGLSLGGATILGAMSASASYIAAPAAARVALPQAHPTYYLTTSLGITFPFNITVGIPLYYTWARTLYTMLGR